MRIHLDRVDTLGSFVELEGVVGPEGDGETMHVRVALLSDALGIADGMLVATG